MTATYWACQRGTASSACEHYKAAASFECMTIIRAATAPAHRSNRNEGGAASVILRGAAACLIYYTRSNLCHLKRSGTELQWSSLLRLYIFEHDPGTAPKAFKRQVFWLLYSRHINMYSTELNYYMPRLSSTWHAYARITLITH